MRKSVAPPTVLLVACGGGGNSISSSNTNNNPATQGSSVPDISGNWQLTATSNLSGGGTVTIVGAITWTGSSAHGTFHIKGSSCFSFATNLSAAISVSGTGAVTISASDGAINPQTITAKLTTPSSGSTLSGTYTISGGCAMEDNGGISGSRMPSVSGSYSGSSRSFSDNSVAGISASLTQSSTPDVNGFFPLSGHVTFTNSVCFANGTINSSFSVISGVATVVEIDTPNGIVEVQGTYPDFTGKSLSFNYSISVGTCSGDSGSGSISRP